MKNLLKAVLSSVLSVTLLAGAAGTGLPMSADTTSATISIFHTNDMHGHLLDTTNSSGVLTTIGADYVASIKKSVPGSLLIDAGDATQGIPFANVSKGADVIKLMNAANYDVSTLGNHEFDYGIDNLLTNVKNSTFTTVSANTMYNGKPLLQDAQTGNDGCDTIKTVNGVKVGIFGITTQETSYKTNPALIKGVTFDDPIKTSQTEIDKLKQAGATVIVGIMHIGNDPSSSPTSEDIANGVKGLNVLIDGHSHTIENKTINGTLIVQTQTASAYVGRIDITVGGSGAVTAAENMITAAQAQKSYTPDPTVKTLADSINASQQTLFGTVVGNTSGSLWGGTVNGVSVGRLGETNLGDLVADAMADNAKTHVAGTSFAQDPIVSLENGGGVRDSIPVGNITQGQVSTILPFGNVLSMKEVTPSVLYQIIENGVSKITGQDATTGAVTGADGRFPQVSGMRYEYNPSAASQKVTKIVLLNADGTDKQVLDRSDTSTKIVLATNDFEDAGGDGYTMLSGLKNIGEGDALDVITAQYIQALTQKGNGTFSIPQTAGRIKTTTATANATYKATVTLTASSGAVANTQIVYAVDNAKAATATTDASGVLTIDQLSSGPHTINLYNNGQFISCYVNNLVGTKDVKGDMADGSTDVKAAYAVIAKILALPATVTASDKAAVDDAKAAYDALTAVQKTLVCDSAALLTDVAAVTPASFGDVTYSTKSITNKDVTVTITAKNAIVQSVSYTFKKNGSHTFTIENQAGAQVTRTVTVTNIDKTNPVIKSTVKNGQSTKAKVQVTVSDEHLKTKTVSLKGKTISWGKGIFTRQGGYRIIAVDKAGNQATYAFTIR